MPILHFRRSNIVSSVCRLRTALFRTDRLAVCAFAWAERSASEEEQVLASRQAWRNAGKARMGCQQLALRILGECQGSQFLHEFAHGTLLPLDGLDELELRSATVEIVAFPMHLEVGVAFQVVSQEPNADFKGDELAREDEKLPFGLDQELRGGLEISTGQGLEHGELHL